MLRSKRFPYIYHIWNFYGTLPILIILMVVGNVLLTYNVLESSQYFHNWRLGLHFYSYNLYQKITINNKCFLIFQIKIARKFIPWHQTWFAVELEPQLIVTKPQIWLEVNYNSLGNFLINLLYLRILIAWDLAKQGLENNCCASPCYK